MSMMKFFLVFLMPLIMVTSCGSDDDDGGGSNITEQQESGCPNPTETASIQSLLNNLSNKGVIQGTATVQTFSQNGTSVTDTFPSTSYDFSKVNDNSWITVGRRCNQNGVCNNTQATAALRDGCLFYDEIQTQVNSASANTLNVTTEGSVDGVPSTLNTIVSVSSNNIVTITEDLFQNNNRIESFRFIGTATGGTTSGGNTTGGTATGGTATGGNTTGGTTTGRNPNEPFEVPNHNCAEGEPVCPEGFFGACEIETFEDGSSELHATCYPIEENDG